MALKWIPRAYGAEVGDHAHSGYPIEMSLAVCESVDSMCLEPLTQLVQIVGLSDEFLVAASVRADFQGTHVLTRSLLVTLRIRIKLTMPNVIAWCDIAVAG